MRSHVLKVTTLVCLCISWFQPEQSLYFSTFLGSSWGDRSARMAVDNQGCIYVIGTTWGPIGGTSDYPVTPGAYDTEFNGDHDVVVTKLDPTGSTLLYSTCIGGSGNEWGRSIVVDAAGNAYVTGSTQSADFPVSPGAVDRVLDGPSDVFAAKLDPTGSQLLYSTFLGGDGWEEGNDISVDGEGFAYAVGTTASANFPVSPGAFDSDLSGSGIPSDVFVIKLDPHGEWLVFSTFLGGDSDEFGEAIEVDMNGNVFVTGATLSDDFPVTPGAYKESFAGAYDVFLTKLAPNGTHVDYSTYLGGSSFDGAHDIVLDPQGCALVTGYTMSEDFPITPGAYASPERGWMAAFVCKFNSHGSDLEFSALIGGAQEEYGTGIALDPWGRAVIVGETFSQNFPTTNAAHDISLAGRSDAFLLLLDPEGIRLVYSTYLGGNHLDWGTGTGIDAEGRPLIFGEVHSSDFPTTPGAYSRDKKEQPTFFITCFPRQNQKKGAVRR